MVLTCPSKIPWPVFCLFLALSSLLTAAINADTVLARDTVTSRPFQANFDDAEVIPNILLNIFNILTAQPAGPCGGLDYQGMTIADGSIGLTGTKANSGSNVLGWAVQPQLQGRQYIDVPIVGNVVAFGLSSAYIACVLVTFIPLITILLGCTFRATGTDEAGNVLAVQELQFEANAILTSKPSTIVKSLADVTSPSDLVLEKRVVLTEAMQLFPFNDDFKNKKLFKVSFDVVPQLLSLGTVNLLDTIKGTQYIKQSS